MLSKRNIVAFFVILVSIQFVSFLFVYIDGEKAPKSCLKDNETGRLVSALVDRNIVEESKDIDHESEIQQKEDEAFMDFKTNLTRRMWNTDSIFSLYQKCPHVTFRIMDSRFSFLSDIVKHTCGSGLGLEVGSHNSVFSKEILQRTDLTYLIRLVEVETSTNETEFQLTFDDIKEFTGRYGQLKLKKNEDISSIPDECLDFVYINPIQEYFASRLEFSRFWPKLKKGGIFAGRYLSNEMKSESVVENEESKSFHVWDAANEFAQSVGSRIYVAGDSFYLYKCKVEDVQTSRDIIRKYSPKGYEFLVENNLLY